MLKKSSIKKICLASFCLLILFLIYLFPKASSGMSSLNPDTTYIVTNIRDTIYLLDKNNYVSRVNISINGDTTEEKAAEMISFMTIGSENSSLIPNGFAPVIPAGTKIMAYTLVDGNFKVDFSSEFLSVSEDYEVKMLEAIIYSLTSLDGIKNITVLVEGEILNKLPHSNEFLDNPLDRSYGINKTYDLDKIKGSSKTTMYYLSKYDNYYYYVPVTKISNEQKEKIEVIIKELTSNPIYETNLMSYLNSETTLRNYELKENSLNLDFNNAILSDITKGDILEEVTYAINLSIKDNYDIDTVSYSIGSSEIATFNLKSLE